LDFNDAYVSQMNGAGHPSDTIAALLTAGELGQRSGRDLITATVLAYEVYCKIGDVFDYLGHGIDHTTVTGMGAVVGAGKLLGLTPEEMVHAIGITVGGNTATRQGRADTLSNWKAYAAADACRKAIFSVQLAGNGMTGPSNVFEGRYGFFKVMSRKPVAPPQLGEPFGIRRCFTKRFPLGQFSQTVAQAAVEARSYFKSPDEILEVNIHASRSAIKIMADGPDKWRPQTHETADHSIPYSAGLALMYGKIDPDYYEDPYLHDARLLDLVSRIKCLPSDEADQPDLANLCELEVVLRSGVRKTVRVEYHRGHFKNPMTDAEMEEKFRLMAQKHLPADRVDNLLRIVWSVEKEPQVSNLIGRRGCDHSRPGRGSLLERGLSRRGVRLKRKSRPRCGLWSCGFQRNCLGDFRSCWSLSQAGFSERRRSPTPPAIRVRRIRRGRRRLASASQASIAANSFSIARADGAPSASLRRIVSASSGRSSPERRASSRSPASACSMRSASRRLSAPAACHGNSSSISCRPGCLLIAVLATSFDFFRLSSSAVRLSSSA